MTSDPRRMPFSGWFIVGAYVALLGLVLGAVYWSQGRAPVAQSAAALAPWQGTVIVLAGLLVFGLMIRKVKARLAWELLLGVTLFLGVWVYAWFLLPMELALVAAAVLTLLQGWVRRAWVHNLFILFGAAGVALNFAYALTPEAILTLLVGLALYDTFAGRDGGPVARFAASLAHRGMIPGLIAPGHAVDISASMADAVRKPDAMFLGAGDLILPLMLVARAAAISVPQAATVALGTLAAAAWLGARGATKPFPALVPLAAGSAIPYLVFTLLSRFV